MEPEEEEPARCNRHQGGLVSQRTVIWSCLFVMVQAGVCFSVIHSSTIFHSQKRLYSDEKLCGLPIMKPSEESNFSEKK